MLEIKDINVSLSSKPILQQIRLQLQEGQIACLIGASGCGKTSLLRTIAGFYQVDAGEIVMDGQCISTDKKVLAVEKRGIGMVFQDLALYPHLNAEKNIAFGIQAWSAQERDKRITELAQLLQIEELLKKYPHQLSGGQQQRIAIARAMAPRPRLLLLDEPFSSLDAGLRTRLAIDIRQVLKQEDMTAIFVSHDQEEAFAIADVIGVMQAGEMLQWDSPFQIYHQPVCRQVANFIGEGVFIDADIIDEHQVKTELGVIRSRQKHAYQPGQSVQLLVRPDDIQHDDDSSVQLKIVDKVFRGAQFLYTLSTETGTRIITLAPSHHNHAINESMGIQIQIEHLVLFPD